MGKVKPLTADVQHVPRPLDDCELEAQTDTEEGYFLLSRVLDREKHALCPAMTETARDQDASRSDDRAPCVVVARGVAFLCLRLKVGRLYPL